VTVFISRSTTQEETNVMGVVLMLSMFVMLSEFCGATAVSECQKSD
jgi:hypothetical protein